MIRSSLRDEKLNWGQGDFLTANSIELYTNRAIAKRAEKVGEIQFLLKDAKDNAIENDQRLALLVRPNDYMTGAEFWALYQKYKDLTGSAFIWLEPSEQFSFSPNKPPKAMHLLRPDLMRVVVKDAAIESFIYSKPNGGMMTFPPSQIFYSYYPDPLNPFMGISLLAAGVRAIDTAVQIGQYHSKVLRNGGRIDGVFKFKGSLSKQQLEETKDAYLKEYASASKGGKPLFLGGDAEYQRVGLTPDELMFVAAKGMALEDICIMTGVPRAVLSSLADAKFDNADAAMSIFLRETIKPLLSNLTQKLDQYFFPDGQTLTFVDPTPENVAQNIEVVNAGATSYFMTANERRARFGMEPLEGGDEIMMPFNLVGMGSMDMEPAPAGTPAKAKEWEHPLRDPHIRKRYGQLKALRFDRMEAAFAKQMRQFFHGQEKRILEKLPQNGTVGMTDAETKGLFDSIFDNAIEIKLTRTFVLPLLRKLLEEGGNDALQMAGEDRPYRMSVNTDIWLDNRASVLGTQLTSTTFEALKTAFSTSEGENESRQALVKRIQGVYEGFTGPRAGVIARTEVHGSYQQGTFDGYQQAGVSTKIWVAVMDQNTRDSHAMTDGQEVPIDQPFDVGGESLDYPGDPAGSAENTINCRCTI